MPGLLRLIFNNSLVCNDDGAGWDTEICDNGCEDGECVADSICTSDEKRCYGLTVQECNGTDWINIEECDSFCTGGVCTEQKTDYTFWIIVLVIALAIVAYIVFSYRNRIFNKKPKTLDDALTGV